MIPRLQHFKTTQLPSGQFVNVSMSVGTDGHGGVPVGSGNPRDFDPDFQIDSEFRQSFKKPQQDDWHRGNTARCVSGRHDMLVLALADSLLLQARPLLTCRRLVVSLSARLTLTLSDNTSRRYGHNHQPWANAHQPSVGIGMSTGRHVEHEMT